MDSYSSCLLYGYGVLPSSPTGVYVSNEDIDFAIVHWDQPKKLGDTVRYAAVTQTCPDGVGWVGRRATESIKPTR